MNNKLIAAIVLMAMLFGILSPTYANTTISQTEQSKKHQMVTATLQELSIVLQKNNPQPKPGTIGGEWLILGLARSDLNIPEEYYNTYYTALESVVKEKQGVLHKRKYTEYSRTVLALTAIGKDSENVIGYNLLQPLNDDKATVQQGINGAIFALLALDSNDYTSDARQKYIQYILEKELPNGGWAITGSEADIDITAMALQALAPYCDVEQAKANTINAQNVQTVVERGMKILSSCGFEYCESAAQCLVTMTTFGVDIDVIQPILDAMMTFYQPGKGFSHIPGGEVNAMATEQGFYALVAVERYYNENNTLYDMTSEVEVDTINNAENGNEPILIVRTIIQKVNEFMRKDA